MKKLLISALSLSILLAGCGQEKQDNKGATKIEKNEEIKYINDKELMNKVQTYFESYNTYMTTFTVASEGGGMSDDVAENIESSGNLMKGLTSEINKFIKNNNLKSDDKKNLTYLSNSVNEFSKFIFKMTEEGRKLQKGEITEEEYNEKLKPILSSESFEKAGKELDKSLVYFENKGLKTDSLNNFYETNEEDDSSDENTQSSDDTLTEVKETFNVNKSITSGPVKLTINKVELGTFKVTEENSYISSDLQIGETAQVVVVYMQQENTTENNVDYYADQAPIITNTGEQLESDSFDSGLVTEMKGKIKSDGRVAYLLKKSKIEDIESITFVAPAYIDSETFNEIAPEQKIEIPLTK